MKNALGPKAKLNVKQKIWFFFHAYLSFDEEDCEWDDDDNLVYDDKKSSPRETHRVKQDASHCGTNESSCQKND